MCEIWKVSWTRVQIKFLFRFPQRFPFIEWYAYHKQLLFLSDLSVPFITCAHRAELTVLHSHGSPFDSIVVVSISDDPTNVRFRCVCCRDYVRRELDAVTSSGVSSTVSKVIDDSLDFNWIVDHDSGTSKRTRVWLIWTFIAKKFEMRALNTYSSQVKDMI